MVCAVGNTNGVLASNFWAVGRANPFIKRRIAGIYAIRNLKNHKIYVGSAVSIYDRLYNHVWHLESGTHHNPKLLNAWRKYKLSAFSLEVLEIVEALNSLLEREQFWIEKLNAVAAGYNLSPNAGSNFGRIFGLSTRKAIAKAASKAMADPIVKARHKAATVAGMQQPEILKKCSDHLTKRWRDPAARALLMASRHNPAITEKARLKQRETRLRMPLQKKQEQGTKAAARNYRVTHPDGQIESIFNLKQFCLTRSLPYSSAARAKGIRHIKGYLIERIER